jgi:hypothetical protein
VLAGEPEHPEIRDWAKQFPSIRFPVSENAVLVKLEPALRERAFAGPLPLPRR